MINHKSVVALDEASFSKDFCRPLYESYCFSRVPGTIQHLLTGKGKKRLPDDATGGRQSFEKVIVFFVDGFGWRFFKKYVDKYPFLKRFVDNGIASKITSQFPSTTAPHVTCINTGLDVGQSGVYEWFYYEPKLDRVIAPLLFSFAGDHELGTLKSTGVDPRDLYPTKTIYQELKADGVDSYVMQHVSIAHSPYSDVMFNGAKPLPYDDIGEALQNLLRLCDEKSGRPAYFYLYLGDIDSMGHRHGIASEEFEEAVDHYFSNLERFFSEAGRRQIKNTACIVIADHGMTEVNPKTTLYLNHEMPELLKDMRKNRDGKLIAPAGSCRDFFLHIEEDKLKSAEKLLKDTFQDIAEIYTTKELIDLHFFGEAPPSKAFLERVGNLVILPRGNHSVWWNEKHRFDQHFYGAHGGLTRAEMETIFLFQQI